MTRFLPLAIRRFLSTAVSALAPKRPERPGGSLRPEPAPPPPPVTPAASRDAVSRDRAKMAYRMNSASHRSSERDRMRSGQRSAEKSHGH
ncbi:hypothetical protein J3R03_000298 [Actinoplanes couchii]|uniref:Uncharacterized protein n=1 Tax=Actinoplanes couchii TaxID=403638 RepID=A0ABQ3WZM0_9ACTN|nr:hypothetical protein [Actinoplanes couchii]GID51717.1 hypothetical protein Aco03nite_001210 [Actinoplanes couchii]